MKIIVPSYSATLGFPGERASALNGNHMEITKFLSKADDSFKRVSGHVARLVNKFGLAKDNMSLGSK